MGILLQTPDDKEGYLNLSQSYMSRAHRAWVRQRHRMSVGMNGA